MTSVHITNECLNVFQNIESKFIRVGVQIFKVRNLPQKSHKLHTVLYFFPPRYINYKPSLCLQITAPVSNTHWHWLQSIPLYGQTVDHLTYPPLANMQILFVHRKQNCHMHPFSQSCMHVSLPEGREGINKPKGNSHFVGFSHHLCLHTIGAQ